MGKAWNSYRQNCNEYKAVREGIKEPKPQNPKSSKSQKNWLVLGSIFNKDPFHIWGEYKDEETARKVAFKEWHGIRSGFYYCHRSVYELMIRNK